MARTKTSTSLTILSHLFSNGQKNLAQVISNRSTRVCLGAQCSLQHAGLSGTLERRNISDQIRITSTPLNLTLSIASAYSFLGPSKKSRLSTTLRYIRYIPPKPNYWKLNSDGASIGNPGPLGAGGHIRDYLGQWCVGLTSKLGTSTNLIAELWSLRVWAFSGKCRKITFG